MVKQMPEDRRKHHKQMTYEEKGVLLRAIRGRNFTFRQHAMDRMRQKGITEQQIAAMLSYACVIEAHNNVENELRVLVRAQVRGDFCCAVLSLTTNEIVTAYWNRAGDHHQTLDRSAYKWNVTITAQFLQEWGV